MDTFDFDVNQLVPVLNNMYDFCSQIMFETEDNLIQIKRKQYFAGNSVLYFPYKELFI
jgi:hypothetical protein